MAMASRYIRSILLLLPFYSAAAASSSVSALGETPVRTDLGAQLVQVMGGLGVVLAMVLLLAWLTKRFNHSRLSGTHGLRLLGGISLGGKERIVLVQAGDVQLLVGVAPGRLIRPPPTANRSPPSKTASPVTPRLASGPSACRPAPVATSRLPLIAEAPVTVRVPPVR